MAGKIKGSVVEVTEGGDLITDISADKLASVAVSSETRITVDEEHETFGIYGSDHGQPAMTLIAIFDGSQPLRLHLVSDSASMMLGVRKGSPVEVRW